MNTEGWANESTVVQGDGVCSMEPRPTATTNATGRRHNVGRLIEAVGQSESRAALHTPTGSRNNCSWPAAYDRLR